MEIPLKIEIEAPEISIQSLCLERIVKEPRPWKVIVWTYDSDARRLQEYTFYAAYLAYPAERTYEVGRMKIFSEGTLYEKEYLRKLRDACNSLLGES